MKKTITFPPLFIDEEDMELILKYPELYNEFKLILRDLEEHGTMLIEGLVAKANIKKQFDEVVTDLQSNLRK